METLLRTVSLSTFILTLRNYLHFNLSKCNASEMQEDDDE